MIQHTHKTEIINNFTVSKAVHKTRNTRTGNGMQGTRGMEGKLYSWECRQNLR